jgi:salicylate hydroxylase
MSRWRIAICGAGTAGLASAAFLARDGHDITVFERFATPKPLGAGLMIQPTGLACLAALGIDQPALALGQTITRIHGTTATGRTIFDLGYSELGPTVQALAMHRSALFHVLMDATKSAGVSISGSTEIASTRIEADQRCLLDEHGRTLGAFDLVIDGTGMRSRLRETEGAVRLNRPYAYGAVWAALAVPADWPDSNSLRQRYDGAHTMAGILPIGRRPGETQDLAAFFWSLRTADHPTWRANGVPSWKARVQTLWPQLAAFLDQITSVDDLTFASYADVWLRRPNEDRLIFIGDAARAASPQLGQGANLALIDALTLASHLKTHATIPVALAAYASARRSHTRFYGIASRLLTPFFQSDSRVAANIRDLTFSPMAKIPYLRREMVRTLAGMKTGVFNHLDPGQWHPGFALGRGTR